MKKILNIQSMLLLVCFFQAKAQTANIDLDINNVRARLLNCGDMFWDTGTGEAKYEFPKGSGKTSVFTTTLWISGIDSNTNNLHLAAQSYRQKGNDYWPGPLTSNNTIDSATSSKWDRFWKINLSEINAFRSLYAGLTNPLQIQATLGANASSIPSIIKQWPAKGNQFTLDAFGNPLPINSDMAPFVDLNNNGLYEWTQGDYPAIKGHQAIWWVFNDQKTHYNSGGAALNIEIKAMAYACATNDEMNDMTFYDFKVRNASPNTYINTRIAQYMDFDLGSAFDDYIGFDTSRRMAICYNGDNFDEGLIGYGSNLTQTACILLKTPTDGNSNNPLGAATFYINGGSAIQGDPSIPIHYKNIMFGKWKDGTTCTDACDAISTGNAVNFLFPDDPSDVTGWSEKQCNNIPSDRRAILSTNSFSLNPNQTVDFNFAFLNTPTGSNNNNFNLIKSYGDIAIANQTGCNPNSMLAIPSISNNQQFTISPNPTSTILNINWETKDINSISIVSMIGQTVEQNQTLGLKSIQVDISNYPKGIYFVKFMQDNRQHIEKITIN